MDYKTRKSRGYAISFAGDDPDILDFEGDLEINTEDRESELNILNVTMENIPQNNIFLFSAIERDDKKGFGLDIRNIKIAKNTCLIVEDCPNWAAWVLKKIFNVW